MLKGHHVREELLVKKTTHGNHSEASINKLGILILLESRFSLAQAERVEGELSRASWRVQSQHLHDGRDTDDDFKDGNPQQQLLHGALGDTPLMHGLGQGRGRRVKWEGEKFGDENAQNSKHAYSAMFDLSLLQELDIDECGKSKRIKAGVPWHVWCQVLGLR